MGIQPPLVHGEEDVSELLLCPPSGVYPTVYEFNEGLGAYAIALYTMCAITIAILALQYGFLVGHFIEHVPKVRLTSMLWVNSVYMVVAVFTMFSLVLPQASNFVWLCYRVVVGIAMGHFVQLTMSWYGGETAMIQHVGEDTEVTFRVRPCCCMLCCPKATHLSKSKIRFMKGCVYQMPYVQGSVLFLESVLNSSGYLEEGDLDPKQAYLYIILVLTVSFFAGIWGLFLFMDITKRYKLLEDYYYRTKSLLLKAVVIAVNVQGILLNILAHYGAIQCIPPHISSQAFAGIIKSIMCLLESLLLGSWAYYHYRSRTDHL